MVARFFDWAVFEILNPRRKQAADLRTKFIREAEYDITHCEAGGDVRRGHGKPSAPGQGRDVRTLGRSARGPRR